MIGLVAALPAETACFSSRRPADGTAPSGRLRLAGIGPANARRAALVLADTGATALLSWGSAGGLDPTLTAGALVLPARIRAGDGTLFAADADWHGGLCAQLSGRLATHVGDLIESPIPVVDSREKQALFCLSGAAIVDMESAAVARVAMERSLPFVAVRVVLDTADRTLPASVLVAIDDAGRLRIGALIGSLLARPRDVPDLLRLFSALRAAQRTLAQVARYAGLRFSAGGGL